jgi:ABC-2 type transport system permease protein
MVGASLYIVVCSARNRVRVRLRRLKEPKYLVGAIVGAAYLYFTIFARMWGRNASTRSRRSQPLPASLPIGALRASGPALVGLAFLVLMALAWLIPSDSGLLDFTEPEVQFLFVAPVSRRQLLVHRMMRSQLSLLFAAIVPALFFPSASGVSRLKFAVSIWVVLLTMKIHFTGISLARASLSIHGAGARRRQWGPLAVMLAAIAIVGAAIARAFTATPLDGPFDALNRLGAVATTGLPHIILWPFMALAQPLFAAWPGPYLTTLALAVGVLLVNVAWVLKSDAAFQEATAQAAARRDAKKTRKMPAPRARVTNWTLALSGRPETMFVWKNTLQVVRETNVLSLLRYGAPLIAMVIVFTSIYMRTEQIAGSGTSLIRQLASIAGALATAAAGIAVLLGPQMARSDLRQDLLHLEVLKTWPLRAADVVRGEMVWPASFLILIAWFALACAATLSASAFTTTPAVVRLSVAAAAALLAPSLVFAQFTIHNAAAVLFPAWVPLGTARLKGIDAMGQRLIMFTGVVLGLAVMMLPGALVGGGIWFAFHTFLGTAVLIPAAAVCTAIVLVEVLMATEALGPVYERLDVSGVERSE